MLASLRGRFVAAKTPDQQAALSLHRTCDLVVRQRTQTINMLRSLLAEFGIVFARGVGHALSFAKRVIDEFIPELPQLAYDVVKDLSEQLVSVHARVIWYTRKMSVAAKQEPRAALLQTIPGVGPITASAIVATIGDVDQFKCGRDLAAWLGLTPINKSTGGKERLGRISKMGDQYIRRLLFLGMTSRIRLIKSDPGQFDPWFSDILARKPAKLAAVAMANKTARIIWAVLTRNEPYKIRNA